MKTTINPASILPTTTIEKPILTDDEAVLAYRSMSGELQLVIKAAARARWIDARDEHCKTLRDAGLARYVERNGCRFFELTADGEKVASVRRMDRVHDAETGRHLFTMWRVDGRVVATYPEN